MKVLVNEKITIQDCTEQVFKYFEKKLKFDNPDFLQKLKMGKWLGSTPEYLRLYERHGTDLVIPFGELPIILKNKNIFGRIDNQLKVSTDKYDFGSKIEPFEYQEPAIQMAVKKRQGVIVAPCGSGKTQIGLEIAARIGKKTLWITHTNELLMQSMERAKSVFDLKERDYGTITGGKVDLGNIITFATVQTMSNIDLQGIKNYFDVVIVDECHHAVGTPTKLMMFYKVVSSLCARYKYGLTATPNRTDGLTPCMYELIGGKIYEITREEVQCNSCPVVVNANWTEYKPEALESVVMYDGTLSIPKLLNSIINNEKRNKQIVQDIINAKGTCLVLTDRIAHIDILRNMLNEENIPCMSLSANTSKKAKEERKVAIKKLEDKEIKVLIATFQLAKEGLDIPSLNNVFFATPQKNETIVIQSAGRVARASAGKDHGIVYDYIDNFGALKGWAKRRERIYKRLGFYTI